MGPISPICRKDIPPIFQQHFHVPLFQSSVEGKPLDARKKGGHLRLLCSKLLSNPFSPLPLNITTNPYQPLVISYVLHYQHHEYIN